MFKIDTGKKGIEAVMKLYHWEIISRILEQKTEGTSGTLHKDLEGAGLITSRASVINYLKALAAEGIINEEHRTGKGGYHGVYSKKLNFEEILTHIVNKVLDSILQAFPEGEYIKYLKSK